MPLFIAISILVAASTAILLHQYRNHAFDAPDEASFPEAGDNEAAIRAA